tara:strand:+ start:310 stop:591 length:282 start_codon:yes stop_codon:yes gene_type:complete
MKKMYFMTILLCSLLNACAKYEPLVDTVGRSGTFDKSRAEQITDDKIMCAKLAEDNTSFLGNIIFWVESPKAETEYEHIVKTCMEGRGHALLK